MKKELKQAMRPLLYVSYRYHFYFLLTLNSIITALAYFSSIPTASIFNYFVIILGVYYGVRLIMTCLALRERRLAALHAAVLFVYSYCYVKFIASWGVAVFLKPLMLVFGVLFSLLLSNASWH